MMRTLILALAAAVGLGGVSQPAMAQSKPPKQKTNPKAPKPKPQPERDLKMNEGTIQAGGSVTLDIAAGGGATAVAGNISPTVGYFVADRFELLLDVGLGFGQGFSTYSFQGGGRLFADLGEPWAYVGLIGGYGGASASATGGNVTVTTGGGAGLLSVPLGVVLPLAKNVGATLGTELGFSFGGGTTAINIPIGYLGVESFFK